MIGEGGRGERDIYVYGHEKNTGRKRCISSSIPFGCAERDMVYVVSLSTTGLYSTHSKWVIQGNDMAVQTIIEIIIENTAMGQDKENIH